MTRPHHPQTIRIHQSGATLLVALVMLIALTLLGLGMFYTTNSEEAMARNFRDKEIAIHAAEVALKEAEMLITGSYDGANPPTSPPKPLDGTRCLVSPPAGFLCPATMSGTVLSAATAGTIDLYASGAPGADIGTFIGSSTVQGLYAQPRYLVVLLAQDGSNDNPCKYGNCFLIVAHARGRLSETRAKLVELFTY